MFPVMISPVKLERKPCRDAREINGMFKSLHPAQFIAYSVLMAIFIGREYVA